MSSVLVGMFDSQADAEKARARLLTAGFEASALSMTGGTATTPSAGEAVSEPHHEGAISHFFHKLFGDDDERSNAQYTDTYGEAFRRGGYGLTVTTATDAETDRAEAILNECGAVDIDEKTQEWRKDGWTGGTLAGSAATASSTAVPAGGTQTLKAIEEELQVGKRTVSRGGVRIFSRLTEVPVQESVSLREEHAEVVRRPVDRPATEADFAAFKEGSVEFRDTAEEAVVSKTARVVEEVEIGKEVTHREETVHDTVRKTEVEVERLDGRGPGTATGASTYAGGTSTGMAAGSGLAGTARTDGSTGLLHSDGSANRDPLTGEPGAHPVGTAAGATVGGVAAGAAVGSVAGPIGTVVGAAAGAVVGGLAGKGVAEKIDPTVPKP